MGLFDQFANVIEWQQMREDVIFWRWKNKEIKKGSKLIIRPGQDAIFFQNGIIEGVFTDEGSYDIETQIIPFLSTLKGFKFGFNSGLRAEVLFVNIKEFLINWGTKSSINIPAPGLPGGMPIRLRGTTTFKVTDYVKLIDKVAGLPDQYNVDNVKERIISALDQLLMKWIVKEGKDMFHLTTYAEEIGKGIMLDLDMKLFDLGITIIRFDITSVTYPEEVQSRIDSVASSSMVGDLGQYQQVAMADSLRNNSGSSSAMDIIGLKVAQDMLNQSGTAQGKSTAAPAGDTKFCSECGAKIPRTAKFCAECGAKLV